MNSPSEKQRQARLYPFLLALEVAGAVTILWHGLPIYRSLLEKTFVEHVDGSVVAWAISGIVLIQAPYWFSTFRVFPWLAVSPHIFAGHDPGLHSASQFRVRERPVRKPRLCARSRNRVCGVASDYARRGVVLDVLLFARARAVSQVIPGASA